MGYSILPSKAAECFKKKANFALLGWFRECIIKIPKNLVAFYPVLERPILF